jgi:uncharacterized protein
MRHSIAVILRRQYKRWTGRSNGQNRRNFPAAARITDVKVQKQYLAQSRAAWAEVISEPVQFIPAGDRIVVFVHARVRPKNSREWQEVNLADVYTFRGGKAVAMRAFADRQEALRWVGLKDQAR